MYFLEINSNHSHYLTNRNQLFILRMTHVMGHVVLRDNFGPHTMSGHTHLLFLSPEAVTSERRNEILSLKEMDFSEDADEWKRSDLECICACVSGHSTCKYSVEFSFHLLFVAFFSLTSFCPSQLVAL